MTLLEEKRTPDQDRVLATIKRTIEEIIRTEDPSFYDPDNSSTDVTTGVMIVALARRSEAPVLIEGVGHYTCPLERARVWRAIEELVKTKVLKVGDSTAVRH